MFLLLDGLLGRDWEFSGSLGVSKDRLDGVWSILGQWEVALPMTGWDLNSLQPNPSWD